MNLSYFVLLLQLYGETDPLSRADEHGFRPQLEQLRDAFNGEEPAALREVKKLRGVARTGDMAVIRLLNALDIPAR